jgi:hypothetical protein
VGAAKAAQEVPSLVAETAYGSAVGAGPRDAVAGHAPEVFLHAIGTDHEPARAGPAKGLVRSARGADVPLGAPPLARDSPPFFLPGSGRLGRIESFLFFHNALKNLNYVFET